MRVCVCALNSVRTDDSKDAPTHETEAKAARARSVLNNREDARTSANTYTHSLSAKFHGDNL